MFSNDKINLDVLISYFATSKVYYCLFSKFVEGFLLKPQF